MSELRRNLSNSDGRPTALLSRKQAADYLGISTRTFDRLRLVASIPFVTIGKRNKFLQRDLNAYTAEQRSI